MQHIHILAVGTLRDAAYAAACAEYQKRLGAFGKLHIQEIPESRLPSNPSDAQIRACMEAEGSGILQKLPPRALLTALCIEGRQLSSEEFSAYLTRSRDEYAHIAFAVGGSHGLPGNVKERAELRLSMSPMTFPHQLARVMLFEQLYRAFSIAAGGRYHK